MTEQNPGAPDEVEDNEAERAFKYVKKKLTQADKVRRELLSSTEEMAREIYPDAVHIRAGIYADEPYVEIQHKKGEDIIIYAPREY